MKTWVLNPPFLKKYSRPQRSPAVTKSGTIYFPIWLSYCVGVLENQGFNVKFTDAPASGLDVNEILDHGRAFQPDLIVMDTSTPSIENDIDVGDRLKSALPNAFIVLVGTHVSAMAAETLDQSVRIDAVARREYDDTIRELACHLSVKAAGVPAEEGLRGIAGLSFRSNGQIIHNPDRPFIKNLDELPWVSRVYKKHLRIQDYFNPNAPFPMVTVITSRGCPFRCSFCVYPQTFTGRKFRLRSIEDVVGEIKYVEKAFPEAKSVFFEDDTLTAGKKRCLEFAGAVIESGVTIPWVANSRIDLDFETMSKMKASGCRELCVGFESGDQKVLDDMGKGTRLERMFRFMADARKAGILIHGCFMIGFPGEDWDGAMKTIDLAIRLNPDTVQFYPIMVYPGTEAYEEYKEKGWLTSQNFREWITPEGLHNCVVRNEALSPTDLVRLCDLGRRRFYLRPRYMAYKVRQMIEQPAEIIRTLKAARTFFKHLILGSKV
jgi:radical SAM superfamily enzyme YgiQ (UPF0313 family)